MNNKKQTEEQILKALDSLVKDGMVLEETINGEKKYSLTMLGAQFFKNLKTMVINRL